MALRDWFKSTSVEADRHARRVKDRAGKVISDPITHGPSPNPATNLVLADVAMRTGGELVRMGVEAALLGRRYGDRKASKAAGRTLKQTLVGAALGRIATRSVPGALMVSGGMLAKTLYDRAQDSSKAREKGEADIAKQAEKGE